MQILAVLLRPKDDSKGDKPWPMTRVWHSVSVLS